MATVRADQILFNLGLAPSRNKAKRLIEEQCAEWFDGQQWRPIESPSQAMALDAKLRLSNLDLLKYVSRSGLKLEGAIERVRLNLHGLSVLDVGQSTGGFTDCCLKLGASRVVGIDVGSLYYTFANKDLHPTYRC